MEYVAGDSHNFGKSVRRVVLNGETYFEKPRPLFWERLFFGTDSPLRPALSTRLETLAPICKPEFSIAESVLGLRIQSQVSGVGRAHEFLATDFDIRTRQDLLVNFGILLSYAYAFGIQDLHSFNLAKSKNRVQALDAEVVLSSLLLPNQTLLLPFEGLTWNECGLSLIFPDPYSISASEAQLLISGFVAACLGLADHSQSLVDIFNSELASSGSIPIRILLRMTRDYTRSRAGLQNIQLFMAESEQMERGDIPYFFKFLNDSKLYMYTSSNGAYEPVVVPNHLQAKVDCVAKAPADLLSQHRLMSYVLPIGVLFLAKKLIPSWDGVLSIPCSSLLLNGNEISVEGQWGAFHARRTTRGHQ